MFWRFPAALLCLRKPSVAYERLVMTGTINRDLQQVTALPVFDRLHNDLETFVKSSDRFQPRRVELRPPNRLGVTPLFFRRREQEEKVQRALAEMDEDGSSSTGGGTGCVYHPLSRVKGLYVYGGVGCGKTMLMDLLYENAPSTIKKHRVHFHHFMLDVQRTLHTVTHESKSDGTQVARRTPDAAINSFDEVAQRMMSNVELLCFDEVAVTDVAHAMILRRLFHAFYKLGVVVIFTSNRAPDDLYLGGLNREGFLPFIELIKRQCEVYDMCSNTDHRLSDAGDAKTYLAPINEANTATFNEQFLQFCKGMPAERRVLRVFGRDVEVPAACGGVCRFHFMEICGGELSAADYSVIAKTFNTVFIEGVPRFTYNSTDVKHRFLLLIDELYEHRCKVVIYAQVEIMLLQESKEEFEAAHISSGTTAATEAEVKPITQEFARLSEFEREIGRSLLDHTDSAFQMERCLSRLCEMRTQQYLKSPHRYEEVSLSTGA
ncbi:ATPase, putative [Trypanosoma equiperdum]|uniref:ATPase, putative n=2 Tax=Trypanozoon TaxID=39700 RepID=Q57XR3_TRYB2|nr:ATPase, putative [Trypanosoma brucei brucei TREU927]AAX69605.1 ATPase, putative [Trypanosoma brucei]AAZ12754.1 ATPase, putative [Trypanosoma brucei brucei TREU927]SCU64518.1 ATPase, putative [Trypanosoma equiperdum]